MSLSGWLCFSLVLLASSSLMLYLDFLCTYTFAFITSLYISSLTDLCLFGESIHSGICKWLSCSGWYVPNVPFEKKTVYIVTEAERAEFGRLLKRKGENQFRLLVKIGKYSIYCSDYNFSNLGAHSSKAAKPE